MRRKIYICLMLIVLFVVMTGSVSCMREKPVDVNILADDTTQTAGSENKEKLALGAKMIYMKYFTQSNSYSISYDTIEDSMAGKDIDDLQGIYEGWNIIYLDTEKMILEKKIDSCGPLTYIISTTETDGDEYVCVYSFDDMGEKMLHSVFDTPVMLFDEATVKELREGILVIGQEALYNALEDFGE